MGKFLDAALNGAAKFAGKAYFFKGPKYFRYDWAKDQPDSGYPLGLKEWGLPAPFDQGIDAAIEGREAYANKAYFFKDDRFVVYDWTKEKLDAAIPQWISEAWGVPVDFFGGGKKIDAAINGALQNARYFYLFCGKNCVKIDWKDEENTTLAKDLDDWDLPAEFAKGVDATLSGWGKKFGTKSYFFLDQKYARYDWDASKCDLKNADLAAWKISWDAAASEAEVVTSLGPEIVPQPWNGRTGKVWVPDGASGKLPLVVYLHGISKLKDLWGAGRLIADEATLKKDDASMNVGMLAGKLIKENRIKPLVVAAPSDRLKDLNGALWSTLDFGAFVDDVAKRVLVEYKIVIDLDKVALVGHSGAGCYLKMGLDKVAREGGKFKAGGGNHTLMLLGLADTDIESMYSKSVNDALAKAGNTTTIVYSVHKGTGGNKYEGDAPYANGFGATRKLIDVAAKMKGKALPGDVESVEADAFDFYADNGDKANPPTRTVAKVALGAKGVGRHWSDFVKAKAAADPRNDHNKMPLVWSWYALQRYFGK